MKKIKLVFEKKIKQEILDNQEAGLFASEDRLGKINFGLRIF